MAKMMNIPIVPVIAKLVDEGNFEEFSCDYLVDAAEKIDSIFTKK